MMCDCKKYGSRWACKVDRVFNTYSDFQEALDTVRGWPTCRDEDEHAAADFRLDQEKDERLEEELRRNG